MISTGARARVRVGCPGLAFDVLGAAIWQVGLEGSIVNVPLIFKTSAMMRINQHYFLLLRLGHHH
jgi:hypothetical protein